MFFVYAIKSLNYSYIYVGLTSDLNRRLKQHYSGHEKTTRLYRPFVLIYTTLCDDRISARKIEKFLKSGCGKEFLKTI